MFRSTFVRRSREGVSQDPKSIEIFLCECLDLRIGHPKSHKISEMSRTPTLALLGFQLRRHLIWQLCNLYVILYLLHDASFQLSPFKGRKSFVARFIKRRRKKEPIQFLEQDRRPWKQGVHIIPLKAITTSISFYIRCGLT